MRTDLPTTALPDLAPRSSCVSADALKPKQSDEIHPFRACRARKARVHVFAIGARRREPWMIVPAAGLAGVAGAIMALLPASAAAQTDCASPLTRFRTVIESDVKVGHLNKSVYERMVAEVNAAEASCRAGQAPAALGALRATQARYGYPVR